MNDQPLPPNDPREWLRRARSNLVQAKEGKRLPGVYLEDLCFQAQQAAEKALKGILIALGVRFPYTHDLATLLSLVERAGHSIPESVRDAALLSDYAVEARYPGLAEPVTDEEYAEALSLAEAVVRWAEMIIGESGNGDSSVRMK